MVKLKDGETYLVFCTLPCKSYFISLNKRYFNNQKFIADKSIIKFKVQPIYKSKIDYGFLKKMDDQKKSLDKFIMNH